MNTSLTTSGMSSTRIFAAYLSDIRFEMLKMLRSPAFAVPTLVFPAMFYVMFGVIVGAKGDASAALGTFARLGVFGTMAPGLFGFGVSLAFEREYGTLTYKQALPLPPGSYLIARMVMAMLFASIISLVLITLAFTLVHAPLSPGQAARVLLIQVLGVLPFCAMGLMVGASVSGQAAPAVVNLVYLPMALLSGLWVPLQFLGKAIESTAPLWPSFHLAQLAHGALGLDTLGTTASHVAALVGVTVLCFSIAMRRLGSRGVRLFGATRSRSGAAGPAARGGFGALARRAAGVAPMWIAIGLIITGFMGGTARVLAAPRTAATSDGASGSSTAAATAADESGAPGVAAPAIPLIADFENGTATAAYGLGWTATDDATRGGTSTAAIRVVDGGAAGSRHALEVSGTVGDGTQYPFTGTSFLPAGTPDTPFPNQPLADYTGRSTLHFYARGDGRQYLVVMLGARLDTMPAMYGFVAGPEWSEVNVPLAELANLDLKRVRVISVGAMEPLGDFKLQLDDIEIR